MSLQKNNSNFESIENKDIVILRELAAEIKRKYRHTFNIVADEMSPDWKVICIETAKKLKAKKLKIEDV
ncbi:MAG: hypothetical protein ACP5QD_04350, partial [Candidatus Ratteibacteria bacterium]